LTRAAAGDLEQIDDATIERFGLEQAIRTSDAIFDTLDKLAAHPGMGHTRTDLGQVASALKFWTVMGRYVIVYRPAPGADDGIEVIRILEPCHSLSDLVGTYSRAIQHLFKPVIELSRWQQARSKPCHVWRIWNQCTRLFRRTVVVASPIFRWHRGLNSC
jgi:plasmid stabilization system protein ParE